ncbi:hypothetical protein FBU30_008969, partial [Linnemannia zychae]
MTEEATKPTVLIVGAGLGGLLLGALLERASIPYTIFERSPTVQPLGSGLLLGPTLMPLFEQLGIMDEFMALGKINVGCIISKERKGPVFTINSSIQEEFTGSFNYNISRTAFHNLLLKQVPTYKILFNKSVISVSQSDDKVRIQTSDNTIYKGDILVGADGTYSTVRQRLYEALKKEGRLPKSDQEDLQFSNTCLVGQTKAIDLALFPEFQGPMVPFYSTMGHNTPYTWVCGATAQKTITWMVIHHLDKATTREAEEHQIQEPNSTKWGPEAVMSMVDQTRDFPLPVGARKMTMGDLYDLTPKDQISKVILEEKVFKTWYSGRAVLLGDACHKFNPSGAQGITHMEQEHGAVSSMHDAIALANLIYALPRSPSAAEIETAFAEYQAERLPFAKAAYEESHHLAQFMQPGIKGTLALFMMKILPQRMWNRQMKDMIRNRPTAGYMRPVENRGTVAVDAVWSTEKAKEVYRRRQAAGSVMS